MLRRDLMRNAVNPLVRRLGSRLVSAIVHGSAVAHLDEDDPPLIADLNLLLVLDRFDLAAADGLRSVFSSRKLEGYLATPVAEPDLPRMAAVFPVETLDLLEAYEVVSGTDPLRGLSVDRTHLEHQVRFELLSKRQALRTMLAAAGPTDPGFQASLASVFPALRSLSRRWLELRGTPVGPGLEDLLEGLRLALDLGPEPLEAFRELQAVREDRRRAARHEAHRLTGAFLDGLDRLVDGAVGAAPENVLQPSLPFEE